MCVRVPKSSPISQLEFLYWTNMNSFQTIISRACHYGLQDQDCKFLISTRPPPPAPTRHINTDHPSSSLSHLESRGGGGHHEDYPGAGWGIKGQCGVIPWSVGGAGHWSEAGGFDIARVIRHTFTATNTSLCGE